MTLTLITGALLLLAVPGKVVIAADDNKSSYLRLPAIYIERKTDRSDTIISNLKKEYEWCVREKKIAQAAAKEDSIIWSAMKDTLSAEYRGRIHADPAPEPDWESTGVGVTTEEEYFQGDKYALIRYGKKYRISKNDGMCRLETYGEYEKQDIDDGVNRFKVSLKHKASGVRNISGEPLPKKDLYKSAKVKQSISPVQLRGRHDVQLEKLAKTHPDFFEMMTDRAFSKPGGKVPFPDPGWKPNATAKDTEPLKDAFQIEESSGEEVGELAPALNAENIVLGQICDVVESGLTKGKIWYLQKMHQYPTIMERPIILKKEQIIGQKVVVEEAINFKIVEEFKEDVFQPPPGIKITKSKKISSPQDIRKLLPPSDLGK